MHEQATAWKLQLIIRYFSYTINITEGPVYLMKNSYV